MTKEVVRAASIYDLNKIKVDGFDAYVMPSRHTHYPEDLPGEGNPINLDASGPGVDARPTARLAQKAEDDELFSPDWDERNLVLAMADKRGVTYLFPIPDAKTMVEFDDNLTDLYDEVARD